MQVKIIKSEEGVYRIKVVDELAGFWATHGRIRPNDEYFNFLGVWSEFQTRYYWRALLEVFIIKLESV